MFTTYDHCLNIRSAC